MDCLATANRRKLLFGLLYLSEGAPIGFIWLGLPTRLRANEVPVQNITWLMAILILPWTLKFLWAPAIDLLRGPRWGFKHWILISQGAMAVTLVPLLTLDLRSQFSTISAWLLLHAFAAATQDIAIDALCVEQSLPAERGALNGWMQCGVLIGRAIMGGGSLVMERWIGFPAVVCVLLALILCSAILLGFARETQSMHLPAEEATSDTGMTFRQRFRSLYLELWQAVRSSTVQAGFLFALTAPAAFKSLEAVIGPFLIDRGYSQYQIGRFTATVMIGSMILGSLSAGRLSGRFRRTSFLKFALLVNLSTIAALAIADQVNSQQQGRHLLLILGLVAFSIGWLTVSMYHWLMDLTSPKLAATQFTAFMAASNACEAWSTSGLGTLHAHLGYPTSLMILCSISAVTGFIILRRSSSVDR